MQEHAQGSWLHFLYGLGVPHWIPEAVFNSWLVIIILVGLSYLGTRRLLRIPSGLQNLLELAVEALTNFCQELMGEKGKGFAPFLGTLFIYILVMNAFGLVPGMLSPTANLNTTLALAVLVVLLVQIYGIKENGSWGYFKHFLGEPLWMFPLMLPIHVIGELARILSLSLRLFGNIMGEDTIIGVLALLSPVLFYHVLGGVPVGLPLPVTLPILGLALFTSTIQALVFMVLSGLYFSLVVHEEHG